MTRLLRSLADGYRRIGLWSLRIFGALAAFAGLSFLIVWPLWTIAVGAPTLYAAIVGALCVGALVYGFLRRRQRSAASGTVQARKGPKVARLGAAVGAVLAAYGALVLLQTSGIVLGILFALAAVVLLGLAGRRVDHS